MPNRKMRLCGDFKVNGNEIFKVEKYPLTKIKDILAIFAIGLYFKSLI